MTDHEVVLHVSDHESDIDRATLAAAGLHEAIPDLRVRIIVNGTALKALAGQEPLLLPEGTELDACATGLDRRGINQRSLRPGVEVVPSAAVTLVEAQLAGAAYLRL